ncbi:uncharacterized protein [Narcine bancroftii]|uniref:uncharacterized protein isoform X2 n=1 Tax=Narcine bancroftii TaxID=1343680 RepID=UPI0038318A94
MKTRQRLYFLRSFRRFGMTTETLTNFYRGVVESVQNHSLVWGHQYPWGIGPPKGSGHSPGYHRHCLTCRVVPAVKRQQKKRVMQLKSEVTMKSDNLLDWLMPHPGTERTKASFKVCHRRK